MNINFSNIKKSRIYLMIVLITFIIYGNSINNEYSLDDNIVVDGVGKVSEGIKGIPEIFTTHYATDKEQSYGYRPLVLLTFAIEKQFFKGLPVTQTNKEKKRKDKLTQANISHFVNVLLYALTGIVLINLLLLLFKDYNRLLPFLITLLFIIHPLHTEPVANIKSRDELMMLLGVLLALIHYLKFSFTSKYKYLLFAFGFVLMAFLSKKSALSLIGLVPVVLYFSKANYKKILISTASIICVGIVFVAVKKGLVSVSGSRDVKYFENPLLYEGSFMDRVTVGLYCSWFYLKMLIFPKDMAYYYGYNYIPMANWSFYQVWLAVIFYVPLGIYGFWRFLQRDVLGLGIVLWLGVMLAFINVLFPIVGIVADRFTYMFSLGFCIVLGVLLMKIFKIDLTNDSVQLKLSSGFLIAVGVIAVLYSARVINRNPDWHDYLTTYYADLEVVENSAKAHAMISNTLYAKIRKNKKDPRNREYTNEIVKHYKRAIEIDSTYLTCYSNLGSAYIDLMNDNQNGLYYCEKVVAMKPDYFEANLNAAVSSQRLNQADKAFKYYMNAIEVNPDQTRIYGMFNDFLSENNMVEKGIAKLKLITEKSTKPKHLYMNIANLYSKDRSNLDASIHYFTQAYSYDVSDKVLCNHIAKLYGMKGDVTNQNLYIQKFNTLK
jgi:protein O-mannosyl-transferase